MDHPFQYLQFDNYGEEEYVPAMTERRRTLDDFEQEMAQRRKKAEPESLKPEPARDTRSKGKKSPKRLKRKQSSRPR